MGKVVRWFKNYWYYYKFYAVIALILVFILILAITQCSSTKEPYDTAVYLYTSQGIADSTVDAVKKSLERFAEDTDKNGEVTVKVINLSYSIADQNESFQMAQASGLLGEIQTARSFLFITDDYRFTELINSSAYNELFETSSDLPLYDGRAYSIKGTAFEDVLKENYEQNNLDYTKLNELYFSLRRAPDENSDNYETYLNCKNLLQHIINGEVN